MHAIEHPMGLIDIPAADYHADKNVVGHSALVAMLTSPAHYWARTQQEFVRTPAMAFGTAVHSAVLEPDIFSSTYVVEPKFDRRTKEGKALAAEWEAENAGKCFLSSEDMESIRGIQQAIAGHKEASRMLSVSVPEQSFFWVDPETGIKCRIRPDALVLDELGQVVACLDLKTTQNASKKKFSRTLIDRGYDLHAAFYTDGLTLALGRELPFYLLAVESSAPFGVALYRVGQRTLAIGRSKYRAGLQMLQWCRENNSYPSYQPFGESEEIDVPYYEKSLEEE